ncbi:MAG: (d)CMP kinase [Oscillospiraceae bacterium]|jgi:cytidylate kinase|nr:(d)CMP kinase [Oscillospiraceae bacterium]
MINIAIDGPAGAGKSTLAREAAKALGFVYADTGALYRAVALYCHRNGVEPVGALDKIDIKLKLKDFAQRVSLNGEDVTEAIRSPEISAMSSRVSPLPEVRAFLLDLQRDLAKQNNVVMDGRDIGTVVLPNADVKIFLTASPEERAVRRFDELAAKGSSVTFDEVLNDLNKRDRDDSNRKEAPLRQASDASLLDTTGLTREQSLKRLLDIINKKK